MSISRIRNHLHATATLIFVILSLTTSVWAWGQLGDRVVARFAEQRLTPSAQVAIHSLLGPGVSLANISTWADEQREVPRSSSWHYVHVPITEPRYDAKYCQRGGCVVSKIEDFKKVLQDPKAKKIEKQRALKFLVNLIADLHQPLHVGDTGSSGGREIQVRFFGSGSNLYRVWESQIMERHTTNEQVWLWDLVHFANPEKVKEWSKGTPADWATETLQVAKKAYCLQGRHTVMESGTKIDAEYCAFALPIIQEQLAKAGVRIAWTLNEIFR